MTDDATRFEQIFLEHAGAVHSYALRRTGSPDRSREVVSETFLTAWRRRDQRRVDSELAWLLAIARRVLANERRSRGRRQALLDRLRSQPAGSLASNPASNEGEGAVSAALKSLSPRQQEVLMLDAWEGLSPAEAGTVLGCTAGAFRVRLHRARRQFRAALSEAADPGSCQFHEIQEDPR
jgi:RNA polymerase sigma-70 factor (ECF subfamily)